MIGIYIITNTVNNRSYIGKSVDINRRFAEHKTPKANSNPLLYKEMKKYGIDKFDFKLLEECLESELNSKELHHIRKMNPYYNVIGKPISEERRLNVSIGTKKWWDQLPQDAKDKVIKNNLTGPRKGHTVSIETRRKLREWNIKNSGTRIRIIETGQDFEKIKDLEDYLGACTGTVASYFKGKIKTVKGFNVEKCRD